MASLSGQEVKKELKSITSIGAIVIIAILGTGSLGATFWAFALTGGFEDEQFHVDQAQTSEMERLKALVTNFETFFGMWGEVINTQWETIDTLTSEKASLEAKVADLQEENARLKAELAELKPAPPVCYGADYECMPALPVPAPSPEPAPEEDYSQYT